MTHENLNNPQNGNLQQGAVGRVFRGYARSGNWIGDVLEITKKFVIIQPFSSNKIGNPIIKKKLKRGQGKIKFIKFNSFNPNILSYKQGGNVVGVD